MVSGWATDAVIEQPAARSEQAAARAEVLSQLRFADMLEHADGRDRVVRPIGNGAVVLQPDLDMRRRADVSGALLRELGLLLRDRDADGVDMVMLGRVEHHRAP